MDENSTRNLEYGHLGKAAYNLDTQSWSFLRTLTPSPRISYTGLTKTAVETPSTSIQLSSALSHSILSQGYPEITAGYRFARNETLSQTIIAANETCNPLVSALLDFGRAVDSDIDNSGRRAVLVVAFASGECGNVISFRTMTDDLIDLEPTTTTQLRVPTIGDEDAIEWLADGSPVRQICFSHGPEERATFMAARFSSTVIFRPLFHRSPISVSTHRDRDTMLPSYQSSRLDPNFLMEISTSHTGGAPHADAKFNPWNQSQLAIVDEDGNWGIWELRNQQRRNKDNWIAACTTSGKLPWVGVEEGQNIGAHGRHDGWLVIEWVGNENHILVCDRRCSMLYRMEGGRTYSYSIELDFRRKSEWILDIKRSTCNPSHIFILTTSRLFWFDINPDAISVDDSTRPALSPLLSWSHFRDSDDTTLQLSSLAVEEDFYLVLFSRLNHSVLAFYCSEPPKLTSDSISAPDPFCLHVPLPLDYAEDPQTLSTGPHFSTLVFRELAPKSVDEDYLDSRLSFLKVFAVDSRLRVQELIYLRPSTIGINDERSPERDILRVRHMRLTGQQQTATHSLGDFIVDDWDESALGHGPVSDRGIDSIAPLAERQFTLDYTQIYGIATGALGLLSQEGDETPGAGFQASFEELVKIVSESASDLPFNRTALEILRRSLVLDDIDQNAQDLRDFVSQFASSNFALGSQNYLLVQPYDSFSSPSTQQVKQAEISGLDLVAIYDRLVNHWLVDLPPNIPGRARITKEKAIRHFVADIVLAQMISAHKLATAESTTFDDENLAPFSTGGLIGSSGRTNEQYLYEPLPTPVDHSFRSQANTTATQSSYTVGAFVLPERQADKCPTFMALSSYTTFSKPDTMSRDTERILSHWKYGIDPALYSLASEESQLAARNRASRRKPRKRMSQAMKNTSLDSSVPLPVSSPTPAARDWGSQPDNSQPPAIRLQSSQVTDDLPMTQVERGAFGGREAAKKGGIKARKKKRAAGF
ncbi:hypothetical protein BDV12DRAFT_170223 [Aspergillus spectabilis]